MTCLLKVVSDPSVPVKGAVPGADPEGLLGMEIQAFIVILGTTEVTVINFTTSENASTLHMTGGWMCLTAGLDALTGNNRALAGN
jgi:hypothetical protein